MTKDYSQVNFRIPTKLKERIEDSALLNERSITAELVFRLEQSFEQSQSDNNDMKELKHQMLQLQMMIDVLVKDTANKKAP